MEMILALLFLSLSSAACIQIFAAARKNRLQAEQWNQIQALTTSVGEILEGTDGTDEQFLSLLPGGIKKNTNLIWYYDRNWQSCSSGEAACENDPGNRYFFFRKIRRAFFPAAFQLQ
mgnify:CR=1 FL=1